MNNIVRYPDVKGKIKIHTLTKNKALRSAPHSYFNTILNDKSRGGILLSKVIYLIHDHNKLNLPLFLTWIGIKASHDLINMINLLPENNDSFFKGDNF